MDAERRPGHDGTGPGEITPDGCAVDLYARLPPGDEPDVIVAAAPPPAKLLELGCGAGRITRELVARGYDVTAVDESAAMLAHVDGAAKVHSSIEDLVLPGTFDVVVLASFLVHAGDPAVRSALLAACHRHVDYGGQVLIQREGADWHDRVPRERRIGDGVVRIVTSEPVGDGVRSVRVEYDFPDAHWTQTFLSRPLTVEQFERALSEAGLFVERYLTPDGTWVAASPRN
jgi:SAM-dependent methyltransferase